MSIMFKTSNPIYFDVPVENDLHKNALNYHGNRAHMPNVVMGEKTKLLQ